ncbi:zinc finger protein 2 homolog [Bradysia coprophila]|nr:zinc finger protein 2 homolog [Bradysia coprophila]
MVRHLNFHLGEHYHRCDLCGVGFVTHKFREQHSNRHNNPSAKKYKCKKCPKVFVMKIHYKKHVEEHKRPPLSLRETLDSLMNTKTTQTGKYKCVICAAQFGKESELTAHTKEHDENKFLCHLCGAKLMNKRNLIVHYRVHTGKPFKCDECGKTFSTKTKCRRHLRNHAGTLPRPHKCMVCGKAFIQKRHLSDHLKTHLPVTVTHSHRFQCDQCPKHFFKEDQLTRHKLLHVGITKPWNCNFCEKSFKTNYTRVEHERTHTGEQPYSCPICGRRFAQQASLRGHRKVHLKPPRPTSGRSKKKTKLKVDNSIGSGTGEATDA